MKHIFFYIIILSFNLTTVLCQKWDLSVGKSINFSRATISEKIFYKSTGQFSFNNYGYSASLKRYFKSDYFVGLSAEDFSTNYKVTNYNVLPQSKDVDPATLYYSQRLWEAGILVGRRFKSRKNDSFSIFAGFHPTLTFIPSVTESYFDDKKAYIEKFSSRGNVNFLYEKRVFRKIKAGVNTTLDLPLENFYVNLTDNINPLTMRLNLQVGYSF